MIPHRLRRRFLACAVLPATALLLSGATFSDRQTAVLQSLDKVTARTSVLKVPVGQAQTFGTIAIAVRACRVTPPEEPPERAAFLEIVEQRPGEPQRALFTGWMFASSPALSALEHPVYDVQVLDCE